MKCSANKIYSPCFRVVFFAVTRVSGGFEAVSASARGMFYIVCIVTTGIANSSSRAMPRKLFDEFRGLQSRPGLAVEEAKMPRARKVKRYQLLRTRLLAQCRIFSPSSGPN